MSSYIDGRACGRRWPADFDREQADSLLPLVPEDGAELRESHPWRGIQRRPTRRPFKVHVSDVGADFALCGVPVADDGPLRPLLPGSLCRSCGVALYTRRRSRAIRAEMDRELARLEAMTKRELARENEELREERDSLLEVLRAHGLVLPDEEGDAP